MKLSQKQWEFLKRFAQLILFVQMKNEEIGHTKYYMTGGDLWSKLEYGAHSINSKHYKRLAIDLNLFIDGKYTTKTEDHKIFGIYWESLGGIWGGRFRKQDGNHYEL